METNVDMKNRCSKTAAERIREDAILPDEIKSLEAARRDRMEGDVFSHEEVWA